MKLIYLHFPIVLVFCLLSVSCHQKGKSRSDDYELKESGEKLIFKLDDRTKNLPAMSSLYIDKDGREYFTFQKMGQNSIMFYDIATGEFALEVKPAVEGPDGVAFFHGYAIKSLDSIFLASLAREEISLIDRNAKLKDGFYYGLTDDSIEIHPNAFRSKTYNAPLFVDNTMYFMPTNNRHSEHRPMCILINLTTRSVRALAGLSYPDFPGWDNKAKSYGFEQNVSRDFNGKEFVYAFHFDEDIYIVSMDHSSIERVKVKSRYVDKINLPDDYGNLTAEDLCANPNYGNLLYDKYRNVYYRIAHPATEIEKDIKGMELLQYGRKNFSIILLDKDFNIIGETLFPDYTYNSGVMFIREDGLYISDSHYLNPEYSDDVLSFRRFVVQRK